MNPNRKGSVQNTNSIRNDERVHRRKKRDGDLGLVWTTCVYFSSFFFICQLLSYNKQLLFSRLFVVCWGLARRWRPQRCRAFMKSRCFIALAPYFWTRWDLCPCHRRVAVWAMRCAKLNRTTITFFLVFSIFVSIFSRIRGHRKDRFLVFLWHHQQGTLMAWKITTLTRVDGSFVGGVSNV